MWQTTWSERRNLRRWGPDYILNNFQDDVTLQVGGYLLAVLLAHPTPKLPRYGGRPPQHSYNTKPLQEVFGCLSFSFSPRWNLVFFSQIAVTEVEDPANWMRVCSEHYSFIVLCTVSFFLWIHSLKTSCQQLISCLQESFMKNPSPHRTEIFIHKPMIFPSYLCSEGGYNWNLRKRSPMSSETISIGRRNPGGGFSGFDGKSARGDGDGEMSVCVCGCAKI